jgi:chromosome segregation ATPase
MNANELANKLDLGHFDWAYEASFMLRQQSKEIEDFRFVLRNLTLATSKKIGELEEDLKNSNINLEYLREKFTERIKEINQLRDELEDCTCQGGHSEAYLKVKGKL